jgi:xanthine dehydrogenase accessory factor
MLITSKGWIAGSVSGGCLESDVVRIAQEKTAQGPALVEYDSTSDADILWGFGLGCNGIVRVLLERISKSDNLIERIAANRLARVESSVSTVISEGPRLGERFFGLEAPEDSLEWFHERISPPLAITIFGAGHDAIPLVNLAKSQGWHVTVVDARTAYALPERFPLADRLIVSTAESAAGELLLEPAGAAVLMNHHYETDLAALRVLAKSPVGYIGVLGPRRRTERLIAELDLTGPVLERIHGPVGLDIGAEGPDQIALAIAAEIQSVLGKPNCWKSGIRNFPPHRWKVTNAWFSAYLANHHDDILAWVQTVGFDQPVVAVLTDSAVVGSGLRSWR